MKTFKTTKGTELIISDIKGKDYLQVAQRILWFREEHPTWTIKTSILEWNSEKRWAVCGAEILDDQGRLIANDIKSETASGFADYLEKATTGAIGRALALCGYGTQFAGEDLDEGTRLADSPIEKPKPATKPKAGGSKTAKLMEIGKLMEEKQVTKEVITAEFGMSSGDMTDQQLDEVITWLANKNFVKVAPGEIDLSQLNF